MHTKFHGVYPVFQTPFDIHENIDFHVLENEIAWICAQGVDGIVFGMVSEALRLTNIERKNTIATATEVAKTFSLPCIASVGAESTYEALIRIDDAISAGAKALMATPPLNAAHNEQVLQGYFQTLLTHSPVPLIVQDASAYVGQSLSVELQARLFSQFAEKVMFKPEAVPIAPAIKALGKATGNQAKIFEGMGGAALLETFPAGVAGSMPGAEVCWAIAALWKALENDNATRAKNIHQPLSSMIDMQTDLDSFIVCEKFLLNEQNVIESQTARSPVSFSLEQTQKNKLRTLLKELQGAVAT